MNQHPSKQDDFIISPGVHEENESQEDTGMKYMRVEIMK